MNVLASILSEARATGALALANARYWATVLPRVHRGLRHWEQRARQIPDPSLRELAIGNLAHERFNTEVAATLSTLSPRRYRAQAIDATVALQVVYDYLDGLSEQPAPDPFGNSRRLFSAFAVSLAPEQSEPIDYYRYHPHRDDGGYLQELVESCQLAFGQLPRADVVAPVAQAAALRCGESQTRTHAIEALGTSQLAEWAAAEAQGTGLTWWEYTAGAVASILCVHALIAAAADARTSLAEAEDLDRAYLYISAVSTLLDSLIDHEFDVTAGSHSFVDYYEDERAKAERIGVVAARAGLEGRRIRHGGHHRMTAAGVAAYYLSAPAARSPLASPVRDHVVSELRPLIVPVLGIFRLWRLAKLAASRR